jgi:hypothetical protein
MSSPFMRKKGYRFLNNDEKFAENMISRNKKCAKSKIITFLNKKISKTMDKMVSWGMSAPCLMMPVTLQSIKNMGQQNTLF